MLIDILYLSLTNSLLMKFVFAFFSCVCLISCIVARSEMDKIQYQTMQNELDKFEWIVGSWKRTNDTNGEQTFEHWHRSTKYSYSGTAYTLKELDTIFTERLAIRFESYHLDYIVTSPAFGTTTFEIKEVEKNYFFAENKRNDFPTIISYEYSEPNLIATLLGGGKDIDYIFLPTSNK